MLRVTDDQNNFVASISIGISYMASLVAFRYLDSGPHKSAFWDIVGAERN